MKKILLLALISCFALIYCTKKESTGEKAAKEVFDSLKKCKNDSARIEWHNFMSDKMNALKDSAEVKLFTKKLSELTHTK